MKREHLKRRESYDIMHCPEWYYPSVFIFAILIGIVILIARLAN